MDIRKMIDITKVKQGVRSDAEVARRCDWTPQSYGERLRRGDMKLSDLERIAEALNCRLDVRFIDKETGDEL